MRRIFTDKLWLGLLGVGNGLAYSGIMLLLIWQWRASDYERNVIQGMVSGDYIDLVANERWLPIVIIWILTFTLASQLVDCFWQRGRSLILFWLTVGILAVAAWNGLALIGTWIDTHAGDSISYSRVTSPNNPFFGPLSLGLVILINFIYGYAIQALHGAVR